MVHPKKGLPTCDGHAFCEIPRMNFEPKRAAAFGATAAPPLLNSRPSAVATLYLDFDGEVVTDPAWNNGQTITAASYTLSASEISAIVSHVGEDFAPFNINVSTDVERYNAAPVTRRMRCIITPTTTAGPGTGGVAYIDSFAEAGTFDFFSPTIPCWVFNSSVVGIAEAVSHELGHTLGLDHDGRTSPVEDYFAGHGSGVTGWAPIMGVGYYKSVVQWSKGEYQYANRQEDDVAIIAGSTNGFGYASDEAGSTAGNSAALGFSSLSSIAQNGVISSAEDADVFSFSTAGGTVSISANPAAVSPNLDISLEIKDSAGNVVASSNSVSVLDASITSSLAAGSYYLVVKGASVPDGITVGYSTYGSIGAYSLTGSVPKVAPAPQSYTWLGGDGSWNDASKWSPTGFPQSAGDTASFNSGSGTITLSQSFSPDSVTLEAGANYQFVGAGGLSGGGTLNVNGALTIANTNNASGTTSIGAGGSLQIGNNNTSGSIGNGSIVNNGTLYLSRSDDTTVTNIISGSGAVNQFSFGTTTLSGANTYNGGTTIGRGVLSISADNNLGAASGSVSLNGGTLKTTAGVTNTHTITVGSENGALNLSGGQLTLGSPNTLLGSGVLSVSGGNLRADSRQSYSGLMRLDSGGSFEYRASGASAGTFAVNGTGNGVAATSGELIALSGVTVSNPLTVNGGILSFESGTAGAFAGPISLGTSGAQVATRDWSGNKTTGRNGTISGLISGSGGLTKSNFAGTLILSNNNTYSGATQIQGGILNVLSTSGLPLPSASPVTVNSGATLLFQDHAGNVPNINNPMNLGGSGFGGIGALNFYNSTNFSLTGNVVLASDTLIKIDPQNQTPSSGALTFSGAISGTGGLTVWSAGNSTSNGVPVVIGSSNNSYTGVKTTFTSSNLNTTTPFIVTLNGINSLPETSNLTLGGSPGANGDVSVVCNNSYQGLSSLTTGIGATGIYKVVGTYAPSISTLAINNSGADTFNGILSGLFGLTKSGAGALTLGGNNSYSGLTQVTGGTLRLNVSNFDEVLGALQVKNGALVDVVFAGGTTGVVKFAESNGLAWNGTVAINGYRGAQSHLSFGAEQTLTTAQLAQIYFVSPDGVNVNGAAKQLANGEIVPILPASSGLIISEFRFHGITSSDEYVELYNNTGAPLNISGWSIRTNTGTAGSPVFQTATAPANTVIPARGHFLFTGAGFSLSSYFGASGTSLGADASDDSGVALFNANNVQQDAVGFTTSATALRQAPGLPSAPTADGTAINQTAFMRDFTISQPMISGNSSNDFVFVSTSGNTPVAGSPSAVTPQIGAPNPEGLSSPSFANDKIGTLLLDASVSSAVEPNRKRIGSGDGGTMQVRRILVNNTGKPLTRVRFIATRITSLGAPAIFSSGQADVRLISIGDQPNVSTSTGSVTVYGTSLEAPTQASPGGGLGSSVSFDAMLSTPLAAGASRAYAFNLQVVKAGNFFVAFNIQALPNP